MTPNYRETQHYIKYLRRKKIIFRLSEVRTFVLGISRSSINIHCTDFFDIPWWSYPAEITLIGGSSIYPQMQKCPN